MKRSDVEFQFSDKVVLVVGGSKGIGKEVCRQFVFTGAEVLCASRTDPRMYGVSHIKCDISCESDIDKLFSNIYNVELCKPHSNYINNKCIFIKLQNFNNQKINRFH